ncbi:hypothetical protein C5C07_20180 [Haloferax sp. Atlit-4N]|nr:hypothetical protein C5C07_20180 [Haloferax sp. Atlit-4N]
MFKQRLCELTVWCKRNLSVVQRFVWLNILPQLYTPIGSLSNGCFQKIHLWMGLLGDLEYKPCLSRFDWNLMVVTEGSQIRFKPF